MACFLCQPDPHLVFFERAGFFSMAGLGPVVAGYSLIATKAHAPSMADQSDKAKCELIDFLTRAKSGIEPLYGPCLVTEHGRIPVCADDDDHTHDAHCYHAHFLLFPGAADISVSAASYFARRMTFSALEPALKFAAYGKEYFLVSPNSETYHVFTGPLNLPRQLARYLVAHAVGDVTLGDWQRRPQSKRTAEIAQSLRPVFSDK